MLPVIFIKARISGVCPIVIVVIISLKSSHLSVHKCHINMRTLIYNGINSGKTFFKNFLSSENPPTKVIESKPEVFSSRVIHTREDCLVLYLPDDNASKKDKNKHPYFEIVLHRPTTETLHNSYSLFRTPHLEEAEIKFLLLKDKLPVFLEVAKEMCNTVGLQKICDVLAEHQSWTVAHMAAHFSLHDTFNNVKINMYINSTDPDTGMSPLQVAVVRQNLKTIQVLVASNCSLEHLDHDGNSVFHYAASTTKEIIATLASKSTPPRCLNARNKNGYTPLHTACLADKLDCVKALLLVGADVNKPAIQDDNNVEPGYIGDFLQENPNIIFQKDIKDGGTPLHWAYSRGVVDALIDMNCHINAINFHQKTALHIMVTRNRLECCVALLSRQANPDMGDKDGNRPIHLAVKEGNIPILQCLIIFGADLNILNNAGETARHMVAANQDSKILYYLHAVGAERCPPDFPGCTEGCRAGGTYNGDPPPKVRGPTSRESLDQMLSVCAMELASRKHNGDHFPHKGRLLCLDGGGIRGLVLVQMLLELEKYFKKPINHCFDWLAGTSTGGILALAIASGKTMQECLCLYFRLKELTFVGFRPYPSEALEGLLKDIFGSETVMADILHPKLIITGVLADRKPVELHLFRNYESPSDILQVKQDSHFDMPAPPQEQRIWQVGRATGAAPTYFRAFGRFLDGGLIANNPTLDALTEIHEHCLALKAKGREHEACPVSVVVSLGTGRIPVTEIKEMDVFRPESIWDSAKLVFGITALGTLLVDQATASDGRVVDRARAWCSSIGVPYFRFSPLMSEDILMDEKSDEKLVKMLWETKAYMHENAGLIKELADILSRSI